MVFIRIETTYIKFSITETSVNPYGNTTENKANQNIIVYNNVYQEKINGTGKTDSNGEVVITMTDTITISVDGDNVDDTLVVNINDEDENVVATVLIKAGEERQIKMPYGSYSVSLDNNWNYRYNAEISDISVNNEDADNIELTVNKTNGKYCENPNSKVENNECIIYDIIPVRK